MTLGTSRHLAAWVSTLDHALGLVQDLFGLLEEGLDCVDELCLIALFFWASFEGLNVL